MSRSGFEPENDVPDIRFASLVRLAESHSRRRRPAQRNLTTNNCQRNGGTAVGQAQNEAQFHGRDGIRRSP